MVYEVLFMEDMNKHVLAIGGLLLVLFLLMVIAAVTYIGAGYLVNTACQQASTAYSASNGVCYTNSTNITTATVKAVTAINAIELVIDTVLALLSLIVVVALFSIVIKTARGFSSNF